MRIATGTIDIKFSRIISMSAFTLLAALAIPIWLAAKDNGEGKSLQRVIFDAPAAGANFQQGTFSSGINPAGAITGPYFDGSNVSHGFIHAKDDTVAPIDVAGAVQGTIAYSISPSGTIAGVFYNHNRVLHGFQRAPNSPVTTFDVAGGGEWGTFCQTAAAAAVASDRIERVEI